MATRRIDIKGRNRMIPLVIVVGTLSCQFLEREGISLEGDFSLSMISSVPLRSSFHDRRARSSTWIGVRPPTPSFLVGLGSAPRGFSTTWQGTPATLQHSTCQSSTFVRVSGMPLHFTTTGEFLLQQVSVSTSGASSKNILNHTEAWRSLTQSNRACPEYHRKVPTDSTHSQRVLQGRLVPAIACRHLCPDNRK